MPSDGLRRSRTCARTTERRSLLKLLLRRPPSAFRQMLAKTPIHAPSPEARASLFSSLSLCPVVLSVSSTSRSSFAGSLPLVPAVWLRCTVVYGVCGSLSSLLCRILLRTFICVLRELQAARLCPRLNLEFRIRTLALALLY